MIRFFLQALVLGPFLLVALTASADDRLLYHVDGNRLVFTNTPRADARPVPGVGNETALPGDSELPRTVYDPFIRQVARETGLSVGLIKAVALVESDFNPHAVSPKGAQGLMQLMPATAAQYGVSDAFDPMENLRAGAIHLRSLLDEFDGDLNSALAAYNAGSSAVRRYGGIPAYPETQDYVRRVRYHLEGRKGPPPSRKAGRPRPESVRLVRQSDGSVLLSN